MKSLLEYNKKSVSTKYLAGLLKNTTNSLAKKFLKSWIKRGGDMVELSPKEVNMLNLIKQGGPKPSDFSTKN